MLADTQVNKCLWLSVSLRAVTRIGYLSMRGGGTILDMGQLGICPGTGLGDRALTTLNSVTLPRSGLLDSFAELRPGGERDALLTE